MAEGKGDDAAEDLGPGCYLTFDSASHGTLFNNWSEAPVDGALLFFKAGEGKEVRFMFDAGDWVLVVDDRDRKPCREARSAEAESADKG